ncbi:MAG: caspase family protein, partial [Pirellulaceae bacterium]
WTPAGYYDASINGHRRFGWQINRGVRTLPDYYRAAQFRETLERPEIMRRLLQAGSLPRAMRQSLTGLAPPPGETAIVNQIRTQPVIRITQPEHGKMIVGDSLTVRAEVETVSGTLLSAPKAFINGIPAVSMKVAGQSEAVQTYQWEFRLPSTSELRLEVFAASEARSVARASRDLKQNVDDQLAADTSERPRPRLHVLAIGVGDYRDRQIQPLDFPARATDVISSTMRQHAGELYEVTTDQLTDRDATGSLWRVYALAAAERLSKTVGPDDLVVMYLCGHGLRDRRTNQWYFVTADAKYRDLMNDRYDDCLSLADLAVFSKLPCAKLAILDSCHSGAVQTSMRPDDLKSVLRFLQDDIVLTWTASEGDQEAAERGESQLGRFTTHLNAAITGAADSAGGNGDGIVSLSEAIEYVSRQVRDESVSEGQPQHPTAGPSDLIQFIDLPLAGKSKAAKVIPTAVARKQIAE